MLQASSRLLLRIHRPGHTQRVSIRMLASLPKTCSHFDGVHGDPKRRLSPVVFQPHQTLWPLLPASRPRLSPFLPNLSSRSFATGNNKPTRNRVDTVTKRAKAAQHQLEQSIKKVVNNLNVGDQMSVLFIVVFASILVVSPYAVRHMKNASQQDDYDERLETDDPVDEFAKLARTEWGVELHETENKNVVEFFLKDVFNSKALQAAAHDFVVQIIQSEPFKNAVGRLVKELWNDLVNDPETVAQVIKLLEVAIQHPDIKKSAQELVLHVFVQEPEVKQALIEMIQSLGHDDRVRAAVIDLLTDSAHTTLNDPDILDHSMEFATDVVGDDIVQKTAGEAIRKSVSHAIQPATAVILTATGVGLLLFSILAIGYSRSSEQEAALFENAARSLQSNAVFGISRVLTWPLRIVNKICSQTSSMLSETLPKSLAMARVIESLKVVPSYWIGCAQRIRLPERSNAVQRLGAFGTTIVAYSSQWIQNLMTQSKECLSAASLYYWSLWSRTIHAVNEGWRRLTQRQRL